MSKKSTMTALSCMRAWKLKLDRYGPSFTFRNCLLCASGIIDTIFLCRQWASISPAVFVLLQQRLEWMRWSIRWPAHTGMWRNSTWLDQKKSKNFSLWSISTRSVHTMATVQEFNSGGWIIVWTIDDDHQVNFIISKQSVLSTTLGFTLNKTLWNALLNTFSDIVKFPQGYLHSGQNEMKCP